MLPSQSPVYAVAVLFGRVGNDPFGRFMQQTLTDEQVDCQHLYFDPVHRTSTVVVDLDEHGERSFTFMVKPSADQFLQLSDIPSFQNGEWLHVCSIALANQPSRSSTFAAIAQMKEVGDMSALILICVKKYGQSRKSYRPLSCVPSVWRMW